MSRPGLRVSAALCLLCLATSAGIAADKEPRARIADLNAGLEEGLVRVSYRLADVLTPEAEERIQSGIPVTFRHRIDLSSRRWMPLVPDRVVSRTVVETRVAYDSLTRRYALTQTIEQKARSKAQLPVTEEHRRWTDSIEEMRAWLNEPGSVPLHPPPEGEPPGRFRVRVQTVIGRDYVLWVFPSTVSVSASTALEP